MRNYGFFLTNSEGLVGSPGGPDNTPASMGLLPGGHDLAGVTDLDFRRFDLDYPDSDAPNHYFKQTADKDCLFAKTNYGHAKSPSRFSEWNREFQLMLSKDPTGGAVPTFMMIRMGTDHTVAAKAGKHAPQSYVADNDYAVGQVVEAVSKSSIWKDTAIFIIEDDALVRHRPCRRPPHHRLRHQPLDQAPTRASIIISTTPTASSKRSSCC